jgi:hypothetical protein
MNSIFFQTFVGREKRPVQITDREFSDWVSAILSDDRLRSDILDLAEGRRKYEDLDEGPAGFFPERMFPDDLRNKIAEKLSQRPESDRSILTGFLLPKILVAVRSGHV